MCLFVQFVNTCFYAKTFFATTWASEFACFWCVVCKKTFFKFWLENVVAFRADICNVAPIIFWNYCAIRYCNASPYNKRPPSACNNPKHDRKNLIKCKGYACYKRYCIHFFEFVFVFHHGHYVADRIERKIFLFFLSGNLRSKKCRKWNNFFLLVL